MLKRRTAHLFASAAANFGKSPSRRAKLYQKQRDGRWITDSPLVANLSGVTSRSASGALAQQSTATVSVVSSGGFAPLSYSWSKISGDAISASNPNSPITNFSATNLALGEMRTARFRATVTDRLGLSGIVVAGEVDVSFTRWLAPTLSGPSSVNISGNGPNQSTAPATLALTSGTAPFTIRWRKISGGPISAASPTALATYFTATGLIPGEVRAAQFECTVTDANGLAASHTLGVQVARYEPLWAYSTPNSVSGTRAFGSVTSDCVVSCGGGIPPYTFSWDRFDGSENPPLALSPNSNSTQFALPENDTSLPSDWSYNWAYYRCIITDASGTSIVTSTVFVQIY